MEEPIATERDAPIELTKKKKRRQSKQPKLQTLTEGVEPVMSPVGQTVPTTRLPESLIDEGSNSDENSSHQVQTPSVPLQKDKRTPPSAALVLDPLGLPSTPSRFGEGSGPISPPLSLLNESQIGLSPWSNLLHKTSKTRSKVNIRIRGEIAPSSLEDDPTLPSPIHKPSSHSLSTFSSQNESPAITDTSNLDITGTDLGAEETQDVDESAVKLTFDQEDEDQTGVKTQQSVQQQQGQFLLGSASPGELAMLGTIVAGVKSLSLQDKKNNERVVREASAPSSTIAPKVSNGETTGKEKIGSGNSGNGRRLSNSGFQKDGKESAESSKAPLDEVSTLRARQLELEAALQKANQENGALATQLEKSKSDLHKTTEALKLMMEKMVGVQQQLESKILEYDAAQAVIGILRQKVSEMRDSKKIVAVKIQKPKSPSKKEVLSPSKMSPSFTPDTSVSPTPPSSVSSTSSSSVSSSTTSLTTHPRRNSNPQNSTSSISASSGAPTSTRRPSTGGQPSKVVTADTGQPRRNSVTFAAIAAAVATIAQGDGCLSTPASPTDR